MNGSNEIIPLRSIKPLLKQNSLQENGYHEMTPRSSTIGTMTYRLSRHLAKKKMNYWRCRGHRRCVRRDDDQPGLSARHASTVALKILIDNGGTKFDPLLVKAMRSSIPWGIYPVGTLLRMVDGLLAQVTTRLILKLRCRSLRWQQLRDSDRKDGPEIDSLSGPRRTPWSKQCAIPEDYKINVAHYLFGDVVRKRREQISPSLQVSSLIEFHRVLLKKILSRG